MIERTAGEMTWFELRSPEGKINLKYRLIEKINSLYTGAVVQNLYFTSFLMQ
jgi:flagellar FliL protein